MGWKTDSLLALQTTQTQCILKVWNMRTWSLQRAETYREAVFSVRNLDGKTRNQSFIKLKSFSLVEPSRNDFFSGSKRFSVKKPWVELSRNVFALCRNVSRSKKFWVELGRNFFPRSNLVGMFFLGWFWSKHRQIGSRRSKRTVFGRVGRKINREPRLGRQPFVTCWVETRKWHAQSSNTEYSAFRQCH